MKHKMCRCQKLVIVTVDLISLFSKYIHLNIHQAIICFINCLHITQIMMNIEFELTFYDCVAMPKLELPHFKQTTEILCFLCVRGLRYNITGTVVLQPAL